MRVLAAAKPEEKVFLLAYLHTGARRSEIFRLNWIEDIDFKTRQIRLTTRKTRDGSTKARFLPMSDKLFESLQWWSDNRPLKNSPYVFPSAGQGYRQHFGGQYVERRWFLKTLCKRAGVKYFGFHALRRAAASILKAHGVSTKTIQLLLGHESLRTTEIYIQEIDNSLPDAVNLLADETELETKITQDEPEMGKVEQ